MIDTEYTYFGNPISIKNNNVYNARTNQWLGHLYIDETTGTKYVLLGPSNKGMLHRVNKELYKQFITKYPHIIITEEIFHKAHQMTTSDNLEWIQECILSYNLAEEVVL